MGICVFFHENLEVHPRRFNRHQWDWQIKQGPDQKNWAYVSIYPSKEYATQLYGEISVAERAFYDEEDVRRYFVDWELEHILICLPPLYDPMPEVPDTGDRALDVWELFKLVGDRVGFNSVAKAANTKPKENYLINLELIEEARGHGYYSFPRQAQIILNELLRVGRAHYREEELEQMMADLVASRALKTRQDPWRIFQFYRPQYIDASLIVRGG